MNAPLPHRTDPTGALSPLLRQKPTLSPQRAISDAGTSRKTAALKSRAPSMWIGTPAFEAASCTSERQASGGTIPPASLWLVSMLISEVAIRAFVVLGQISSRKHAASGMPAFEG